ncbi:hypothetical protein BT93_C0883 [Corymbia citriodora subsp. variegata]|nr:hypothetical protein BT93_C0883 [Corymbia citriodora subsp. variegata]
MKVGVIHGAPGATLLPLPRARATVKCSSSSSSGHLSFIKDVAATEPPKHLHYLLKVLQTRGETIVSPGSRQGLIPLVIPLAQNLSGDVTGLLRWPTALPGMEMPVVEVRKHGVWLLAKNVDQYIHRILVEEDANSQKSSDELYHASSEAGKELYNKGDFAKSQMKNLEAYLLKKVGMFPDVLEHKVTRHFDEGMNHGDWRVLHQERSLSRIWTSFCFLCRDFTKVILLYSHAIFLFSLSLSLSLSLALSRYTSHLAELDGPRKLKMLPGWL